MNRLHRQQARNNFYFDRVDQSLGSNHLVTTKDDALLDTFETYPARDKQKQAYAERQYILRVLPNADIAEHYFAHSDQLARQTGAYVVDFNYRGVSDRRQHQRSAADLVEDVKAQIRHLVTQGVAPGQITVYGQSIGAAAASIAVAELYAEIDNDAEQSRYDGLKLFADRISASISDIALHLVDEFIAYSSPWRLRLSSLVTIPWRWFVDTLQADRQAFNERKTISSRIWQGLLLALRWPLRITFAPLVLLGLAIAHIVVRLCRPFIKVWVQASGWEMNVAKAYLTIPEANRMHINIAADSRATDRTIPYQYSLTAAVADAEFEAELDRFAKFATAFDELGVKFNRTTTCAFSDEELLNKVINSANVLASDPHLPQDSRQAIQNAAAAIPDLGAGAVDGAELYAKLTELLGTVATCRGVISVDARAKPHLAKVNSPDVDAHNARLVDLNPQAGHGHTLPSQQLLALQAETISNDPPIANPASTTEALESLLAADLARQATPDELDPGRKSDHEFVDTMDAPVASVGLPGAAASASGNDVQQRPGLNPDPDPPNSRSP